MTNGTPAQLLRRIRAWTALFIVGLVLSGATALPLETELAWLARLFGADKASAASADGGLQSWIHRVWTGLRETNARFPFVAYGTDWLAFAHIVIAIAFLGPLRDPVRNVWVIEWGMIACVLVIPLALIFGPIRNVPFFHRLIDCSFGVGGIIPLWLVRNIIKQMAKSEMIAGQ